MRAGRLRHQIVIQICAATPDGAGAEVKTWSTFATLQASYEPLMGKELFAAQQEQARATTRFRVRFVAGITPKMRVSFDNRLFNIESVIDPYGRGRELHLMCAEDV